MGALFVSEAQSAVGTRPNPIFQLILDSLQCVSGSECGLFRE